MSGLELRKQILEMAGHNVDVAYTAGAAREGFLSHRPDFVVLDLRLPEASDGRSLIRQFHAAGGAKLLVLSGWPEDLDGHDEQAMVDHILAKPARSDLLLQILDR